MTHEESLQEEINRVLGLSFWRRNWGVTVGILTSPLVIAVGFVARSYPFDVSVIGSTSQMIVGFSSFLVAAWTFGLSYFWPSTEYSARQIRAMVLRMKPPPKDAVRTLKGLRLPFWLFVIAMFGIVLMILSAFLAVAANLYSFRLGIMLSLYSLLVGSVAMIGTWVQLYSARDTFSYLAELAPDELKGESSGSEAKKTTAQYHAEIISRPERLTRLTEFAA